MKRGRERFKLKSFEQVEKRVSSCREREMVSSCRERERDRFKLKRESFQVEKRELCAPGSKEGACQGFKLKREREGEEELEETRETRRSADGRWGFDVAQTHTIDVAQVHCSVPTEE